MTKLALVSVTLMAFGCQLVLSQVPAASGKLDTQGIEDVNLHDSNHWTQEIEVSAQYNPCKNCPKSSKRCCSTIYPKTRKVIYRCC